MILIAHRGNISGPNSDFENSIPYIQEALNQDYNVEVDVWFDDNKGWFWVTIILNIPWTFIF
jgi:hypothetical protein